MEKQIVKTKISNNSNFKKSNLVNKKKISITYRIKTKIKKKKKKKLNANDNKIF